MPTYDPRDIPVESFYSETAKDPLPTSFSGAIGTYNGYPQNRYPQTSYPPSGYPQNGCTHSGYNFPTTAQPYHSAPPPHHYPQSTHRAQHAPYDPSYSPSHFVQPSLHSQSYGFPTAPQSTVPSYNIPSPLARRNSVVDHAPRTRPPVSDYSSLIGALDASVGPTRVRSNSIQKHALVSPYKTATRPRCHSIMTSPEPELMRTSRSSKPRRGSKHIGPCLPDGPSDYIRVPQETYAEPVTELGYQKIDHHRLQPIAFQIRGSSTPGVSLRDIHKDICPGLEAPDDRVFEGVFAYREAKIRVLWPGYPPLEKRFRTQDGTRRSLLIMVAAAVSQNMLAIMGKPLCVKRGFEAWTIGRRSDGSCGLRNDHALITGIEHRGGANFQVEIWVPKRKMGIL